MSVEINPHHPRNHAKLEILKQIQNVGMLTYITRKHRQSRP